MGVMPEISQAVEEMDWNLPTDIQAESIPMILGGGDVLMAAETGSGKTGAFCLPVIQVVFETIKDVQEGKMNKAAGKSSKPQYSSKWKMNMFDRTPSMAIDTEEGLLCQSRDPQGWHGTRANKAVTSKGKYYYEMSITDDGLCRVGWSTGKASHELGCDREGFGFGGTGKKSFGKQFDTYGESFGLADVIGSYIDLDCLQVKWSKNGRDLGKAYDIMNSLKNSVFYPAICLKNAEVRVNFGAIPFKHPPQDGYVGLNSVAKELVIESQVKAGVAIQGSFEAKPNAPYAIIMEPSRELAEQTTNQIKKFKTYLPTKLNDLLVVGGVSAKEQVDALNRGVDIVVGTPGRMEDLISTKKLLLSSCMFFILDECDGLLLAGYGDLITRLYKEIPQMTSDGKRLQMIVCSATLHSFEVKKLAERLMHFPTWIDLKGQDSVPETVHHVVLMVDPTRDQSWKSQSRSIVTDTVHARDRINHSIETPEVLSEAVKLLKGEYVVRAIQKLKMDKAMLFCRTKVDCDNLENHLNKIGGGRNNNKTLSCVCLHGDRKPNERRENLEKFKTGVVRFLICTDVAARGLDVSGLPYVVNVTMPDEKQSYVHRIGRVGRAERMGLAISLASTVKEKVWYHSNCSNRGKGCINTRLTTEGGCCIWYDETKYLGEIEEHLGVTIDQTDNQFNIQVNEFDGKVTYGQKKSNTGDGYKGHVEVLAPAVQRLAELERKSQCTYVNLRYMKPFLTGF